jgi:hypothetical protein
MGETAAQDLFNEGGELLIQFCEERNCLFFVYFLASAQRAQQLVTGHRDIRMNG